MRAKEFLKQAYILDKRIDSGLMEISELRQRAECLSSLSCSEKVNVSAEKDPPFMKALSRIWELEQKIDEEVDRLVDLKNTIKKIIDQVEEPNQQMILRYRYINFERWESIADRLGIGLRWVYKLHGRALAEVERILSEKNV